MSEEFTFKPQKDDNKFAACHMCQPFSYRKTYNRQQSGLRFKEAELSKILGQTHTQLLTPKVDERSVKKLVCCHQSEKNRDRTKVCPLFIVLHTSDPEQTT